MMSASTTAEEKEDRATRVSRRSFVKTAAAAALAAPTIVPASVFGADAPSNRIALGCIGVGNQGRGNLKVHLRNTVAVCEVDRKRLGEAKERVEKETRKPCAAYGDYRKLLDDKNVDAVILTTPDHWHALQTIHACEAGKDVYCEKPLTLTVAEGRAMVDAARRTKRIVQTGSQQRSDDRFRRGCELVRSGRIGKVHTVRVGLPGVRCYRDSVDIELCRHSRGLAEMAEVLDEAVGHVDSRANRTEPGEAYTEANA